jgi:hypothetical protein
MMNSKLNKNRNMSEIAIAFAIAIVFGRGDPKL